MHLTHPASPGNPAPPAPEVNASTHLRAGKVSNFPMSTQHSVNLKPQPSKICDFNPGVKICQSADFSTLRAAWTRHTEANLPAIDADASPSFRASVLAAHALPHTIDGNGLRFVFRHHLDLLSAEDVVIAAGYGERRVTFLAQGVYHVVSVTAANVLAALVFVMQGEYAAVGPSRTITLPPRKAVVPHIPAAVELVRAAGLLTVVDLDAEVAACETRLVGELV